MPFDWKSYLRHHPIFSTLPDAEIQTLLDSTVSKQREFEKDEVIIREREPGNSIFLIGSGSVLVLHGEKGQKIPLLTLYKEDFFGEMALFEERPRSATVIAQEPCVLLEIKGQEFLNLVQAHPNIEIKVFAKLSERLRHMSEKLLSFRLTDVLTGVDEKLKEFDTKLVLQLQVYDAKLKAAQALFDQTNIRAHEIIESADRSRKEIIESADRNRTKVIAFGSAVVMILTVGGGLGIFNVMDVMNNVTKQLKTIEDEVKKSQDAAKGVTKITDAATKLFKDLDEKVRDAKLNEIEFKERGESTQQLQTAVYSGILVPSFKEKLEGLEENKKYFEAEDLYRILVKSQNNTVSQDLIGEFVYRLIDGNQGNRARFKKLLWLGNHEEEKPWDQLPNHRVASSFLFLAFSILDNENDDDKYKDEFLDFQKSVQDYGGMNIPEGYMTMLDEFFSEQKDKKKYEAYKQLKDAIPTD